MSVSIASMAFLFFGDRVEREGEYHRNGIKSFFDHKMSSIVQCNRDSFVLCRSMS
jgi:hypothetical protein